MQDTCTRNIHTETHTYTSTRTTARAVRKAFRPLAPNLGTCIIVLSLRALLRNGIVRRVAATRRIRPRESSLRREDGTSLASNEFFFSGSSGTKFAERARNARGFRPTVPARSVPAARCASYKKKKLKLQSQSQCLKCVLRCANPVIERELSRAQTDCNANVERCLTETKVQARHPGGPGGGAAPTDIRRPEETRGGTIC